MQSLNLKMISNLLFAAAFICAALMLTNNVFGYRNQLQTIFLISGALALLISLVASRMDPYKSEFNVIYWIGNLAVFIALIMRNYTSKWIYVFIGGMLVTALSYFINPFNNNVDQDQEDELLDQ